MRLSLVGYLVGGDMPLVAAGDTVDPGDMAVAQVISDLDLVDTEADHEDTGSELAEELADDLEDDHEGTAATAAAFGGGVVQEHDGAASPPVTAVNNFLFHPEVADFVSANFSFLEEPLLFPELVSLLHFSLHQNLASIHLPINQFHQMNKDLTIIDLL